MAFRMKMSKNAFDLSEIMNVSHKIGSEPDCINRPNDVEAVQRLMNIILPTTSVIKLGFGLVKTDGKLDALTGFYIFKLQRAMLLGGATEDTIDGCVSKASGLSYGGNTVYTITEMNRAAKKRDIASYDNFMKTFVTKE